MIKQLIQNLNIPKNEILFVHAKLKGLNIDIGYQEVAKQIIGYLEYYYKPKTILIPTFTYSYTKTGLYDRLNTPSEVGRFGEEARELFDYSHRTLNPVFNVIDTHRFVLKNNLEKEYHTAFGNGSLLSGLSNEGYFILNINLDKLINTHLHLIEYENRVPYRFIKYFNGVLISEIDTSEEICFEYFVRNLDIDTAWRRDKIKDAILNERALNVIQYNGTEINYVYSQDLTKSISEKLELNPYYLISD